MYLGSDFHRFWARCSGLDIHPDDVPYLLDSPFSHEVKPCPFDGPLERAKVVICLANPSYGSEANVGDLNRLVLSHRSGEEMLAVEFDDFYRRITAPIGIPLTQLRATVAIFNVCPYCSPSMPDDAVRRAAGLPSVWQAQKYLREILIPRAQTGNIFLVLIRKLQLWGVTQACDAVGNVRVVSGRAISGVMSEATGKEVRDWLVKKKYVPFGTPGD